ncbi:ATP-binding protein [Geobacter argillaceus]|uniref:histidine kinase n=1 Tax=Geobacter argillaceus TaxID=345631 RepID=A0A562V7R8_9BACT|nr:ATP-binding protein [Geobacter argillaceus]TWJ13787.1 histidine kinase/DNA gyrase B/HSP90-like ATPase [Geobacter argillaceus]
MVQTTLSIAVIAVAILFSFWMPCSRCERSLSTFSICVALLVTALLETFTLRLFLQSELFNYWEKWSLYAEALIPGNNARHYIDNPDFQQDMLRSLDNTVNKMQGLIGRLKNLGEKELLNLQPVDLKTVVRRAMAFLPADRVTVGGEPLVVKVDAEELQKVLLNLLLNAVEASPDGSQVAVEVAMVGAPHIRVVDHGSGMSADYIRRELFKPFATTKKKGLGIGLYQSRQIVEAHGGRLEVQSEVGKGTVFTVWLKKP